MKRKRISTRRQKRELVIPTPSRNGNIKVTREGWLNCARVALIEDGIDGVKVDRLAKRLKVTRGGFYHHFKNHNQILDELLLMWKTQNRFTPVKVNLSTVQDANDALDRIVDDVVHENGFDPQFDMAVREWARISHPVARVVHEVDDQREDLLAEVFEGIGYVRREAVIRARVFYWHQVGYYAVGKQETITDRENYLSDYFEVFAGTKYRGKFAK